MQGSSIADALWPWSELERANQEIGMLREQLEQQAHEAQGRVEQERQRSRFAKNELLRAQEQIRHLKLAAGEGSEALVAQHMADDSGGSSDGATNGELVAADLLSTLPSAGAADSERVRAKYVAPEFFSFGTRRVWCSGLTGFVSLDVLTKSIEEECCDNDNGIYKAEYMYVTTAKAQEQRLVDPCTGVSKVKERGHDGWGLDKFLQQPAAVQSRLKLAHVVVIRLYTGKLFKPWNEALRALSRVDTDETAIDGLRKWATCITVLYEAIIFLGAASGAMTVLRGVNEGKLRLPPSFLDRSQNDDNFAGGVEFGFMSTTRSQCTADAFSGGPNTPGSILRINFDGASRGANLQPFSMWPEEEELLFPPFTYLTVTGVEQEGAKRVIAINASISTANLKIEMDLDDCANKPTASPSRRRAPSITACDTFKVDLYGSFGICGGCRLTKAMHKDSTEQSPRSRRKTIRRSFAQSTVRLQMLHSAQKNVGGRKDAVFTTGPLG